MSVMSLDSVEKACRSIGGIQSIIFFADNGFLQLPEIMGPFVMDPINYINSPALFSVYYRRSTANLTERKRTNSDAGDFYEYDLSFYVPKNRLEVKTLNHRLQNRTVHAVCTDRNGFRTLLLGLRHSTSYATGERRRDRNGYNFQFTTTTDQIAPEYQPDVIDVPDGENCPNGLIQLDGAQLIDLNGDCLIQLSGS